MGFPDRSRFGRTRLAVELLEDRTTPTKFAELTLPELVATGAVAGDRVNVVMSATTNNASDAAALAAAPFASSVKALGFGIYSVTLTTGTSLGTAAAYYSARPGVATVTPDVVIQVQRTPNDPSYSSLYGMTKIGAPAAWDSSTGNRNFVVAVIDTGVDYNHPDLAANMWKNAGEIAGNGVDDDRNGYIDDIYGWDFANNDNNPMDDNGHGTHVAGTIGAVGNNGVGVAGVNWSTQIMALKFLSASGSGYTSNAVAALNYAVARGVKLSNNSWGGGGYDSSLAAAIGRAQTAGHIFVAAAGNSGQNIDAIASYPASYIQSYNNVVTVAATGSNDALASFSNYGASSVTLAAPGVGILSTTPNNTYSSFSGTSMAAPHVTGAIALYWSANPTLAYSQVIAKLKSSVDPVSGLSGKVSTGGRLNVGKMFASTSPPVVSPGPKVTAATFSGATATQLSKVRVTFDRAINASTFTAADVASFTGPNGAITTSYSIVPVAGTNNTQFDITFGAQTVGGNYSLTFGPNIADATGKLMDQNGNGTAGEATADRYTAAGTLVLNVTKTYSATGLPLAIRDYLTTTSTITITDAIQISDLNVKVNLTHTYDSDLVITLTAPTVNGVAGKTVTLFNRRGGSGDNLTNTTFDDEAAVALASAAAPFNGTFRADALLSAFDGSNVQGVWTLKVTDMAAYDTGSLTGWSLVVSGTTGTGPSGKSMALGFHDEPTFAHEGAAPLAFDAAPIAVEVSAPARSASAPSFAVDYGTSRASAPVSWMAPEAERRASAWADNARGEADTSFTPRESRFAAHDDFDAPHAAAVATLYFAPESSDSGAASDFFFDAE
ncbi:S8 family serine peptidase [Gemmata sp. G18]|uniref:S8 family serine peptidase n=1 Tax=Gemmata palustris TaxID=2822762 RepID=A0ABS5BWD7_9BACT|nr:S8 family serine peptidase [Gemmata palustris]MBP3957990.1 S8 family serine peptidase [Gemmata palustris]